MTTKHITKDKNCPKWIKEFYKTYDLDPTVGNFTIQTPVEPIHYPMGEAFTLGQRHTGEFYLSFEGRINVKNVQTKKKKRKAKKKARRRK